MRPAAVSRGPLGRLSGALFALGALLGAAWAQGPAKAPTTREAKEQRDGKPQASEPAPRTSLRVVIDSEPYHLNPILDPDLWGYRIAHDLLCEPLLRRRQGTSEGGAGAYEGALAESFSITSSGEEITIALRRGARFHDGKPVTAYDVRATLERLGAAGRAAPRTQALVADLLRVEVLSAERLRLVWRRGGARALAALAQIDILAEASLSAPGPSGAGGWTQRAQARRPSCSGPFRLHEWRHGEGGSITLRRAATYQGPAPALDELRFLVVPDAARGLALLRKGEAEVLGRVPSIYYPEQVDPALLAGRLRSLEVPANQLVVLLWNGRRPLLAPVAIRRALGLLVNRGALVRDLRRGLGQPLRLPPPLTEADALLSLPVRLPAAVAPAGLAPEGAPETSRAALLPPLGRRGLPALAGPGLLEDEPAPAPGVGALLGRGVNRLAELSLGALSAPPTPCLPPARCRDAVGDAARAETPRRPAGAARAPAVVSSEQAAAEALLDAAGALRLSPAGVRALEGRPLRFNLLLPTGSSEAAGAARRIAEASGRAGITLVPEPQDLPTLQLRVRRGEYDAALLAWSWTSGGTAGLDDLDLAALLSRSGAVLTAANEGEFEAALLALARARPSERAAALQRLSGLWLEREPLTVLYRPRQIYVLSERVLPVEPSAALSGDFLWLRGLRLR